MQLPSGTRLGPYEIIALLGAGGMGEVYRARDTRLDRQVALKVLAPALAGAASFRERFDREARSIAALSHPNICTLHDVGRDGGIDYLVMEYLDGETLAARIARQAAGPGGGPGAGAPLPLDETLRIGTELAEALAAAHRAGIVHRDLKPGNVMVTRRGVKVLDFGLAKFAAAGSERPGQTETLTRPLTGVGAMVGTLPYMAPEQLEGRDVDARTDIFALGAILYEMATGRRPFSGASQASLIAAILDREPEPISTAGSMTPPGLDRLVRKCLAKDPDARWQGASDIADELRWIASGAGLAPPTVTMPRALPRPAWRRAILAAAACVVAAVIAVGLWLWRVPAAGTPPEAQHSQVTFDGRLLGAAISPDGHTLAYAASPAVDDVRVFVRDLAGGRALEVWKGRLFFQLAWLPNGSQIAVSGVEGANQGVWAVPRLGGTSRRLASSGPFIAVVPRGSEIALGAARAGGFRIVSLDGEGRVAATLPLSWMFQIEWTTDRQLAVLGSMERGSRRVWTVSRDGQDLRELYSSEDQIAGICASPITGAVYVIRQRQESADLLRIVPGGAPAAPEVLLTGLSVFETGFSIANGCSVSADGERLVYRRGVQHANLWRLDLDRTGARASLVTHGTSLLGLPAVSPDGAWIAATKGTDASAQILKIPSSGGEPIAIASGSNPAWSPDGKRLAFISRRGGAARVWVSDVDGHGAKEIAGSEVSNAHLTWLPDGRVAWPSGDARNYIIHDVDRSNPGATDDRLLEPGSEGFLIRARFSPRGDRVAAFWNVQQKGIGLWVITWPGRAASFLGAGLWPVGWSADGQWIYAHKHGDGTMLRVSPATGKTEPAGIFPGVTLEGGCDLTPDRRAMICALLERNADAWLVEHFDPQVGSR